MKQIMKRIKNQRGLTLIELLAVVVILGIIAAIAVPNIGKIIENTKEDAKVAEALQIINAAKIAQASDSGNTSWVYEDATGENVGELKEYLSKVKVDSQDFIVTYSNGVFSIKNHPAVPSTETNGYTEEKLAELAQ